MQCRCKRYPVIRTFIGLFIRHARALYNIARGMFYPTSILEFPLVACRSSNMA
jgi:hypothetical protein